MRNSEVYEVKYSGPAGQKKHLALWHREVLSFLETLNRGQRVLEIGCGNGRLTVAIAEMGFDVLGTDASSEAIEICRGKGLEAEKVDVAEGIPYEDEFDICVSTEVIEHVFDSYHYLAQVNKSLKPGGTAVLTTPNFGYYRWQWRYLRGESPTEIQNPLHIRFFTASYLTGMATLQGFKVLHLKSPVHDYVWAEQLFERLGLEVWWAALTRRWGKTVFAVLRKVDEPRYSSLLQVMGQRTS